MFMLLPSPPHESVFPIRVRVASGSAPGRVNRSRGPKSAQPLQGLGGGHQVGGQPVQFGRSSPVDHRGQHVLGGAAELEDPVGEMVELAPGEHHGVLGQADALYGAALFVGSLPAGLRAVATGPPGSAGRQPATAPRTVTRTSHFGGFDSGDAHADGP